MKFRNYLFIAFVLLLVSCENNKPNIKTELSDSWQFKSEQDSKWLTATVPGVTHLDLINHGIIKDPYFGIIEDSLQWIGEKVWEYKTEFSAKDFIGFNNIDLVFEGLDTYSEIYLNDSLILITDNMYRTWRYDVKPLLKDEVNTLLINFLAVEEINNLKIKSNSQKLPDERAFTRKAPYHFGWDWGPKYLTAGIWKPVFIEAWQSARIDNIHIIQDSLKTETAFLSAVINLDTDSKSEYKCIIKDVNSNFIYSEEIITNDNNTIQFEIIDPKLWWTKELGDANLYDINIELYKEDLLIDSISQKIGLRTIELVQVKDSIGKSFYFKLNGKTVFIKGANYIPNDNFLPRVSNQTYEEVIESAVWANMNMLRVWGGGIYEDDYFYELCDKNGILVWQDFMFSCAMYPGDSAFMESVKQEAIDNVIRLRNHPSIALWCGNNEVDNGWKDWGWQKQLKYSKEDSLKVWNDYKALFHEILPEVISNYDSQRDYWPSSPEYGWGHKENFTNGDSHYWGVWWGFEPFEVFNTKVPRFMSEYGFQALPNYKTIEEYSDSSERYKESKTLVAHQKHARGFETINHYMKNDYNTPSELEDYTYISQLLQAEGMTIAIEAQRRNQPHCMGTLYWQLNDCWPVCSWSSVDYFKRKKASHYFVKEAYKPIIVSYEVHNDSIDVFSISNSDKKRNMKMVIQQYELSGNLLNTQFRDVSLESNSSKIIISLEEKNPDFRDKTYFYITLIENEEVLDEKFIYFNKVKDIKLPKSTLKINKVKEANKYKIEISSDVLIKNLELISDIEGEFSENYFDMNAGNSKIIYFYPKENKELNIKYRCINNL